MKTISLNGTWQAAGAPDGTGDPAALTWHPAPVPGMAQQVAMAAGELPDPYLDRNAEAWRQVAEMEWWYRRTFAAPDHAGPIELHFDGLDTYAGVYLNGTLLATHANMFRPLTLEVTGRLQPENELLVRLRSPLRAVEGLPAYPFWNGTAEKLWARKAQVSYGWDFTPPLITTGIWRDVSLRLLPRVALRDLRVETVTYGAGAADLVADLELAALPGAPAEVTAAFRLTDGARTEVWTAAVPASGSHRVTRYLDQLAYWWPNGLGEPHLYTLEVRITPPLPAGSGATAQWDRLPEPLDGRTLRVGFRTIGLRTRNARGRAAFLFHVNGRPVFARGGNWIPQNALLLPDPEGYRELLTMARDAHMNMVRVWGGGIYEHDAFYDLCDELGLMVWQDFMWGCARYPTAEAYVEESRREAESQVRRLRNHPSIVAWVGDNEDDMGFHATGHPLNRKVLRQVCAELDPTRPYHPSSPSGGADPNSPLEGDRHNWTVWHGDRLPYTAYARDTTPFASEFGMQGVPDLETIREGISEPHLWPLNEVWAYHTLVHDRLKDYMRAFGTPGSVAEYIELSQRTQAASDAFAVRHYRSRAPACGGALVWQLNDIWPAVSWSLIDVRRRPKLSYWAVKRACAPVICFVRTAGDTALAYLVNDDPALDGRAGTFRVQVATFDGRVLWERAMSAVLPPAPGGTELLRAPLPELGYAHLRRCALRASFTSGGAELAADHWFLADERDLELAPVALDATARRLDGGAAELTVRTRLFAHLVRVAGGRPDDDGFDVWPDRPVTIRVAGAGPLLRVRHLAGPWQEVPTE